MQTKDFEPGSTDLGLEPSAVTPPSPRRRVWLWSGVLLAMAGAVAIVVLSHAREQQTVREIVRQAAIEEGIDPVLAEAIVQAESRGNPLAKSRAGAYGLMQLLPATASELADRPVKAADLLDPRLNATLGCRYVRRLLRAYNEDLLLTLMAYNAGMGRVAKWRAKDPDPEVILDRHAFAETRAYVRKILRFLKERG